MTEQVVAFYGVPSLWNGVLLKVMRVVLVRSLSRFFWQLPAPYTISTSVRLLGFACAAFFITYPLEFLYTSVAIDLGKEKFANLADGISHLVLIQGISVYTGLWAGLLSVLTQQLTFSLLTRTTAWVRPEGQGLLNFLYSISITLIALSFALPFDTIMSVQIVTGASFHESVLMILQNFNLPGLWNGIVFSLLTTVIANSVNRVHRLFISP